MLEDPNLIRFTQDSIGNLIHTLGGESVPLDDFIGALQSGAISPQEVEPIAVFYDTEGNLWSLDNRRLYAARKAGVPVNTRPATPEEFNRRNISTKNNGGWPCVRGK